jgi:hypothetical protein
MTVQDLILRSQAQHGVSKDEARLPAVIARSKATKQSMLYLDYERMVPIADQLYDVYIVEIRKEGLIP